MSLALLEHVYKHDWLRFKILTAYATKTLFSKAINPFRYTAYGFIYLS